jgi:hypothetical protein
MITLSVITLNCNSDFLCFQNKKLDESGAVRTVLALIKEKFVGQAFLKYRKSGKLG